MLIIIIIIILIIIIIIIIYFEIFGIENIPKEIKNFIGTKNIVTNIYRMQAYNSITSRYFCIGVIDFILTG